MPAPRTSHGILKAEYSTDNSTWTEITKIVEQNSEVRFIENPGDASNHYGGNYAAPEQREYEIEFLNRTVYDTLKTNHDSDTGIYYRFTLDNDELHTTDNAVLPQQLVPVNVQGKSAGRGDRHKLIVADLKSRITETTA